MDYMKLVADLCQIIDRQNEITKAMAVQLGQRDALRYEEEMAAVRRDYDTAMGEVDLCKADMKPCVWAPGTAGLWQWEAVT